MVAKGLHPKLGINHFNVYTLVAIITTTRVTITPTSFHKLMVVKTFFLNGDLDKEIYKEPPKGFIVPSQEK